jgi:hypothetical protein
MILELRSTYKLLTGVTHLFTLLINCTEHEANVSLAIDIYSANWKILEIEGIQMYNIINSHKS